MSQHRMLFEAFLWRPIGFMARFKLRNPSIISTWTTDLSGTWGYLLIDLLTVVRRASIRIMIAYIYVSLASLFCVMHCLRRLKYASLNAKTRLDYVSWCCLRFYGLNPGISKEIKKTFEKLKDGEKVRDQMGDIRSMEESRPIVQINMLCLHC